MLKSQAACSAHGDPAKPVPIAAKQRGQGAADGTHVGVVRRKHLHRSIHGGIGHHGRCRDRRSKGVAPEAQDTEADSTRGDCEVAGLLHVHDSGRQRPMHRAVHEAVAVKLVHRFMVCADAEVRKVPVARAANVMGSTQAGSASMYPGKAEID
eukprot:CAMPEP_0177429004 /NCGR_PEP_ID=MMETSP0368-20130122/74876_1 /TAXON_ID=447022 ORGANISM="Scrippsiella hangoei-like, Strain SHHI-4" /NCGR_SAMPLE_ID=MMETSP0368 /ASSEMBLY_ACC=CAM_ASM_000363 /LENGTH=152 /DNA_ID=CAMNT_0018899471 /DNA_START=176 /DNA_END=635 /DNA_ORIENTATION=+